MSDLICRPRDLDSEFVERPAIMIERDRHRYPQFVANILIGGFARVAPEDVGPLEHSVLLEALVRTVGGTTREAAFVAGRCTTLDADADAQTLRRLEDLASSFDPSDLQSEAFAYVDSLMSLALLGQPDMARQRLTDLVTIPECANIAGYHAAEFLAQLGSPVGYPVLYDELHDASDPHGRTMATRRLAAFVPFDGEVVGGLTIDVQGELVKRLRDKDDDLAQEVPGLLIETGLDGVDDIIRAATKRPYKRSVRQAAKSVLASIERR